MRFFLIIPLLILSLILPKQQIKKGDVLISFSINNGFYQAEVLRKEFHTPQIVKICKTADLNFANYGAALYSGDSANDLYTLIFQPLEPYIKKGEHLYFSPIGKLFFINLSALKNKSGVWLGDYYHFHRLSSLNEYFKTIDIREQTHVDWLLFGGMDYLADPELMFYSTRMLHVHEMEHIIKDIVPFKQTDDMSFGTAEDGTRAGYDNLKHSRDEIKELWKLRGDYGIQFFTGYKACEEEFRFEVRRTDPYIALVSTHGFTYNRDSYDEMACGLLFSGAGHTLEKKHLPYRLNDGILYSQEIESLDMHAASLVVLAACNTGLGVVTQDGIIGLQSAFKKAGVQTLVLTLWSINDKATAAFTKSLFTHIEKGKNKRDAFELAIIDLRRSPLFGDPVYWAPFILLD